MEYERYSELAARIGLTAEQLRETATIIEVGMRNSETLDAIAFAIGSYVLEQQNDR